MWGYMKKRNTNIFVSSGVQVWGPRVRTVGVSEIMLVDVRFRAIRAATVRGRWWRPRLELSGASLDAFGPVPGVRHGVLVSDLALSDAEESLKLPRDRGNESGR